MNRSKSFVTKSLDDLSNIAKSILGSLDHPLVLLIGDLGAGKTTLVKEFLKQLDSEDLGSSPSYSLINEYKAKEGALYHLDLYRLNTLEEAWALGLEDILYSGSLCLVEWPQLIMDYLEPPYSILEIKVGKDSERRMDLSFIE